MNFVTCHRELKDWLQKGITGKDRDGRGQSAPGHFHRKEVHQPRPLVSRSDSRRQHGPDEGGGEIRIPPRLQVFHLRHLVDPPGDYPLDCRPGAHDPHSGAHDRDHQQADASAKTACSGVRPGTHSGRSRRRDPTTGRTRTRRAENGAAADLVYNHPLATATTRASAISSKTRGPRIRAT